MNAEAITTRDLETLLVGLGFKEARGDSYAAFKRERALITVPATPDVVRPAYLDVIAAQLEDFGVMTIAEFWGWAADHQMPGRAKGVEPQGVPVMRRGPRP